MALLIADKEIIVSDDKAKLIITKVGDNLYLHIANEQDPGFMSISKDDADILSIFIRKNNGQ
jgi:hypothetical protein